MEPPTQNTATAPPPRPARWREALSARLFLGLAPRLPRPGKLAAAPQGSEELSIPRPHAPTTLAATFVPATGEARGAVLLTHPWLQWGKAYFYRSGRIDALRAAGYHCLVFDLAGIGGSPRTPGFFHDRDVEAALEVLGSRADGLPLHLWGVSAGGCWSHPVLARRDDVAGAVFEDVSIHLLEWSKRKAPWGRPFYAIFQYGFPDAYRYLDQRRHAPALEVRATAYVGGDRDDGVPPDETRDLAERAGGRCLIVPGARHLGAIRADRDGVIALALETFERAVSP